MARLPPWTAVLAALLSVAAAGCGDQNEQGCPSGQTFCVTCRDPASFQTDPANCGACGIACGHGTCAGGVCQCEDWTFCPGQNPRCADTQNDPANCNGCGLACTELGAGCAGGVCGCYEPRPNDCSGTLCTNWLTDPDNCGTTVAACGKTCPLTNAVCVGGTCRCPASLPTPCPTAMPTQCVNLQTDEQNCGGCGNVCAAGATCSGTPAQCVCPPAAPDVCSQTCVDKQTDEQNCGACGTVCGAGQTCCSGVCKNTSTDPQNCGGCGNACPGSATCSCGASCQTQHANGLGQFYYDCGALDQHTLDQARLAAIAWNPSGSEWESGLQCGFCLCRQSATAAAVWCYAGSPMKGLVQVTPSPNCLAAACPISASAQAWH